jgi:DNA-binding transcriptional LysR family regulator
MMNWDDVRIFLAVARHGSLRAAGRVLGVSQPTIGRRLAAFEASFGGPTLFDRLPDGLRLNAAGEALIAAAERLEGAALGVERRRAAASPALSGTVRVSVGEWAASLLAQHRSGDLALAPELTLELVQSPETANLARRDADLALRHGVPEGGNLYVSKVGTIAGSLYRRRAAPDRGKGPGDRWVAYTEEQAHFASARWLDQQILRADGRIALRAADLAVRAAAVGAGVGIGLLPCYLGDADPHLERLMPPVPELAAEYWVIVHRDLRRAACVRAVVEWIRRLFEGRREALLGIDAAAQQTSPLRLAAGE